MKKREEDANRNGQVPNTEGTVKVFCWVQFLGCCGKPKERSFWAGASKVTGGIEVGGKNRRKGRTVRNYLFYRVCVGSCIYIDNGTAIPYMSLQCS